jgi:hypothetical protein
MGGGRTWIRERPELILSAEATKNHPRSLIIPVSCLSVWPCLMSPIGSSEHPCRSPVPFKFTQTNIYPLQISRFRMPSSPSKSSVRKRAETSFCSILCTYISTEHTCAMQIRSKKKKKKPIKSVLSVYAAWFSSSYGICGQRGMKLMRRWGRGGNGL